MRWSQGGIGLAVQSGQWATPIARDWKDGTTTLDNTPVNGILGRQVLIFQPSPPDPAIHDGPRSSSERKCLNPLFCEWLMGLPFGLSGFERAETELSHWLQLMRGCLSALRSRPIDQPRLL